MSSRTVLDLLPEQKKTITIGLDAPVQEALRQMSENGFSQLPVIDSDNKLEGIVSTNSILAALKHFRTTLDYPHVHDALSTPHTCLVDADLFEILDVLEEIVVVLVIDNSRLLLDIITAHDAAKYLRQNAEDLMYVADVENTLKQYIEAVYADEAVLSQKVGELIKREERIRDQAKEVLIEYLKLLSPAPQFNSAQFRDAFSKLTVEPVSFNDLTLNDYIELWLHMEQQSSNIDRGLDNSALRNLFLETDSFKGRGIKKDKEGLDETVKDRMEKIQTKLKKM